MTFEGPGFVVAVIVFAVLTAVLEPLIEKIGDERLSIISAASSLITTLLALLTTELISDGLTINGLDTWLFG